MALYKTTASDTNTYDVLIIGGGPAALSASIYLRRAELKVGFIEQNVPGGKVTSTSIVDNYCGFANISGPELALKMFEHATSIGAEYIYGKVTGYEKLENNYFVVYAENGQNWFCKSLIIATGTLENKLNVPGEQEFMSRGVSYCAVCDGPLAKGKDVAIVGSGNSALVSLIFLSSVCKKVYLLNKFDKIAASQYKVEDANKNNNIEVLNNTEIVSINGKDTVNSVTIINNKTNEKRNLDVAYVYIYIGSKASIDFVDKKEISKDNIIEVDKNCACKEPGLFAAGDVNKLRDRQIANAVADGATSALSAIDYLKTWK